MRVAARDASLTAKTVLTCEASSNPEVLNYTWIRRSNKSVLTEGEKQTLNGSSTLILADGSQEAMAIACIATNAVGSSTPCSLLPSRMNGTPAS